QGDLGSRFASPATSSTPGDDGLRTSRWALCLTRECAGIQREASGKRPPRWFDVSSTVGSKTEEDSLMSTDVISQPSISHRGRRTSVLAALAIVVVVGVAGAV